MESQYECRPVTFGTSLGSLRLASEDHDEGEPPEESIQIFSVDVAPIAKRSSPLMAGTRAVGVVESRDKEAETALELRNELGCLEMESGKTISGLLGQ